MVKRESVTDSSENIKTLVDLLRWRAKTKPDQRAYTYLKDDKKTINMTYGELDARARALAAMLQRKGLEGHRALLLYPPGLDYIVGFFGCLYANVIAVPAYPPDPNRLNRSLPRLQAIVNDSKTTIALTTDSILYMIRMMRLGNRLGNTLGRMPFLRKFRTTMRYFGSSKGAVAESRALGDLEWISSDSIPNSLSQEWNNPEVTQENIAFLQYTSGSTGNPKGVILTHHNLLSNSQIIYELMDYKDQDSEGVFWIPIYHDMGLIGAVLQPLYGEVPSTLMSPIAFLQRPLRWLDAINNIEKHKIVGTAAPNFAYELCIKKAQAAPERIEHLDLSNWQVALSGAEPIRAQTMERFTEIFGKYGFKKEAFFPAYGLAEATLLVTGSRRGEGPRYLHVDKHALKKNKILETPPEDENAQTIVSCGYNHPMQRVAIVNPETFEECKPGEIGEIWVKGPSVSRGYYGREKETAETFHNFIAGTNEGPFLRTGDLGFMKDEHLYVTGRLKDLIIIRGTNHYPQDIELTVESAHPMVRQGCSAAFTVEENGQEELVVVAEVRQSKNADFGEVIDAIRQAITANHDLQALAVVLIKARTINKTSSGKIQRRATKEDFLNDNLQVVAEWRAHRGEIKQTAETEPASAGDETFVRPVKGKDEQVIAIENFLISQIAEAINVPKEQVDIRKPFISFGMDSAQAVGLAGDLEDFLGRTLPPTLIWDYPTIEELARYLAQEEIVPSAKRVKARPRVQPEEPIAIIGMGARFPRAQGLEEFWQLLKNNVDGISEVPPDRWDKEKFYHPEAGTPGKMVTKFAGFVDNVDLFDAGFFGISPREAVQIDPQQRLLLEVTWEALEHAGLPAERIMGSKTGVFIGISTNDYVRLQQGHIDKINPYSGTGNAFSIAANRISYLFDLQGPSMALDTACSSSLVAVHEAVQSLMNGDCDMALAGGVNLILSPELSITFSQAHMLSPDGRCKTFDAKADGYGRGEGAGVVILKRLSDAIKDGDRVLAVIRGSAVNQDGKSNGITAPNGVAQQNVILAALSNADVEPDQVQYVEAHGTGTPLGDPIEIESIKRVLLQERSKDNVLYIGSVKTNIGHLEAAAGIAGLIKTVLALYNEEIPAHLHFSQLNPHIDLKDVPIRVAAQNVPWKKGSKKRVAGVSAFGFGGTNAHVILEEAPQVEKSEPDRGELVKDRPFILPISAKSTTALNDFARSMAQFIQHHVSDNPEELYDALSTAALRRTHHDERLAIIAESKQEIKQNIYDFIEGRENANVVAGRLNPNFRPKIAFVFSGQGPQWWAMGRELYNNEPVFKATIDRISLLLQEYADWSLTVELLAEEEHSRLDQTEIAQPALFAIQVALSALWRTWGILPDAVVGHSVGEVAAAHLSGILSLDTAVKVIYHRSRLMQKATGKGKMAAIDLPLEEVEKLIEPYADKLSIGAHNSHTSTVISGDEQAIDAVLKELENRDVFFKKLPVNYAFHSPIMDEYREELISSLEGIQTHQMQIPIVSTVRGAFAQEEDYGAEYWAQNVRNYVHFSAAIDTLLERDYNIFIEIGPHPVLRNYIQQNVQKAQKQAFILPSLRRKEPERRQMLKTFAQLYTMGYPVDWRRLYSKKGKLVDLPHYPFQRQRFWITDEFGPAREAASVTQAAHPLLGEVQRSSLFPASTSWSIQLRSDYIASLAPNKFLSQMFVPEAAYLEMAVAASRQIFSRDGVILKDIVFKHLFTFEKNQNRQLQVSLTPVSSKKAYFQAYSRLQGNGEQDWMLHSLGTIISAEEPPKSKESTITRLTQQLNAVESIESFFPAAEDFIPTFKPAVQALWTGEQEVVAKIDLSQVSSNGWSQYHINPLLINMCLQFMAWSIYRTADSPYLFSLRSLKSLKLFKAPPENFWLHLRMHNTPKEQNGNIRFDFHIYDEDENLLLVVEDLRLKQLALHEALSNITFTTQWKEVDQATIKNFDRPLSSRWLIFSDGSSLCTQLTQQLQHKGYECLTVTAGEKNAQVNDFEIQLNLKQLEEAQKLLQTQLKTPVEALYFWNLQPDLANETTLEQFFSLLNKNVNQVWLVTQRAVSAGNDEEAPQAQQAFLADFGSGLAEAAGLQVRHVDIAQADLRVFNRLLHAPQNEKRLVLRGNRLFVERLVRHLPFLGSRMFNQLPELNAERQQPAANEIEVEIKAIGLLPRDSNLAGESQQADFSRIGLEFAGIVTAVGSDVKDVEVGQRVMGLTFGALKRFALTRAELVMPIPEKMSFEQAASLPFNYLTAHYALSYLAQLNRDERILIHNADSPTGMALIRVARVHGAQIFATVKNKAHMAQIKQCGADHVFLARSLAFVDEIFQITADQGVDVIVNTSNNEQLISSFALLKDFGRFIELNPQGAFQQSIVYHHLRYNVSFFAIDLEHLAAQQPQLIKRLVPEVFENIRSGKYPADDLQVYTLSQFALALRRLNNTANLEKLVISFQNMEQLSRPDSGELFLNDRPYLVVGQWNANNEALTEWMFSQGAKRIKWHAPLKNQNKIELPDFVEQVKELSEATLSDVSGIVVSLDLFSASESQKLANELQTLTRLSQNLSLDFFITVAPFILQKDDHASGLHLNDFLLALHQQRWLAGLPSLFVQLGGKIPQNKMVASARWSVLRELLPLTKGHIILTEANFDVLFKDRPANAIPAFFEELVKSADEGGDSLKGKALQRADLLNAAPEQRFNLVRAYLAEVLAGVIKVPVEKISFEQPLTSFGIDSLMAIELKNTVESNLGVNVPIAILLQGPSLNDLTSKILEQLEGTEEEAPRLEVKKKKAPASEPEDFKLSHGQRAMYFQHTMNPDSVFNLAYAVRIRSDFDRELLKESFQRLIDRHPALRTTFHLKDGEPVQRVHPTMPAFFVEEDVQNLSDAQIRERLQEEVQSHFDLENGPLMRVYLFKRGQADFILLFVMHHIITDIWSQAVLLDELSRLFETRGDVNQLPPLEADYTDFVQWQDDLLNSPKGEKLLSYWTNKLQGELPVLNLPTDRPRPPVQTFKGKTETLWFPGELSDRIHRFCEQAGVTPFTLLLSAYYLLLHRYTAQNDIIVGSPTAGRSLNEFTRTVGYFVNPLPLRVKINTQTSFKDFLNIVKQTVLEAFENMDYPLTLLVEKLQPKRDPSRTPLFQTMFVLERAHLMHDQGLSQFALSREGAQLNLGGLTIESMNLEQGVAPFDLTMMAVESGKGLAVSLGYNIDLFNSDTIQRMLEHYLTLIRNIVQHPECSVSRLEILPDREKRLLLEEWSKTGETNLDLLLPVHQQFTQNAHNLGDKTALIFKDQSITYRSLNEKANRLANFLIASGVGRESIVGVCLDRSLEMVEAILGVLKSGAAYLPIDPNYPTERIRYMITDSNVKLVITTRSLMNKIPETSIKTVLMDEHRPQIEQASAHEPGVKIDLKNLAYIIYTSGSTGRPKGTMLQHLGLANVLQSTRENYRVSEQSRVLQFASFSFDASVEEIFSTLTAGGTLILAPKETLLSLPDLIRLMKDHQITNVTLPPSVLNVLRPEDFPSLQTVVSAGEKCHPELARRWAKSKHFVNGYGPTEATICTTSFTVPSDFEGHTVPIGKPIKNMRVYVLDKQLRPTPIGVPGELYIAGPGLARGYLNRPDLSAEKFVPNPFADEAQSGSRLYRTGDLVRFLADGNLEFIGRIDHQVKVRGFRIELGEIEAVLIGHPQIKEAAVVALTSGNETRLIAYYVAKTEKELSSVELKNYLLEHLPDYMVPAIFMALPKLPLTANGKIDRAKLPDPDLKQRKQIIKPGSEIEQKLSEIWKQVLHLDQVSVNDNFFELGGHSLGIIQVQGKIKEVFDREIDIVEMFKYPTIRALARFLDDKSGQKELLEKVNDRAARQREATRIQQQRMMHRRKRK